MKKWIKEIEVYNNMRELIDWLNARTKEYDEGNLTVSDREWDNKFFELVKMEEELGFAEQDSPTQRVNWDIVSGLQKITHNHPMLSLNKTKDIKEVKNFVGDKDFIAMTKLDGLTCSLTYVDGHLISAETRGNGEIGEDITHNAKVNASIPLHISYRDKLVVDGEIICDKKSFFSFDEKNGGSYKNPRNFASGKIRALNSADSEPLSLSFVAWDVIEGFEDCKTLSHKLTKLLDYGFLVTPFTIINSVEDRISFIQKAAEDNGYPIDGVVFKFNDIEYYQSLGRTEHHFKGGIAYKFYDEEYKTELLNIEWSMGRTGVLTPVAIFDPIDIDGTLVERASLHNLSILRNTLGLYPEMNQKIWVYKANQIIPQIAKSEKNDTPHDHILNNNGMNLLCPICGQLTEIKNNDNILTVHCVNPDCDGKLVNKINHFVGKKGLDVKGLSKMTLEKLINWGWINNIQDIFELKNCREEWIKKPGFGVKSVDNILAAIEGARHTTLDKFIASLGIPLIGTTAAKSLAKIFDDYEEFRSYVDADDVSFEEFENFGYEMNLALKRYDYSLADEMIKTGIITIASFIKEEKSNGLNGLTFVITGKLSRKRDDIKADIEAKGGKVTGSVSSKTSYLVCNDKNSNTGKSKDAKALGIPIITEEELNQLG